MWIKDDMTALGIELKGPVSAELVMEGLAAFKANQRYIDYTDGWYIQTTDKEVIIAMTATDGFLSGNAHNNFSENKFRIFGWFECFFAMKAIKSKEVKFNHYCGFSPFNRDRDYVHYTTGVKAQFFQTVERFGAWHDGHHKDIKPYIEIQNWHGETKLNKFIARAEEYANIVDPNEYIRYINEDRNRHLYTGELKSVFRHMDIAEIEQLMVLAVLKYGPMNTKTWFEACKEAAL
jgi:hypothetical protein